MKIRKSLLIALSMIGLASFSNSVIAANTKKATTQITKKTVASKDKSKSKQEKVEKIKTYSKISYVVLNKNTNFVDSQNKKLKTVAKKSAGYHINYVRHSGSKIYYGVTSNKWIPATATHGTVWYEESGSNTMILSTNKKGKLAYQIYESVNITPLVLKRNSYVYNEQGILDKTKSGGITILKKGKKVSGYSVRNVAGTKYYITNYGWIKYNNVAKIQVKKTKK
ncbi:hypothetical protein [Lactobacillus agrestimuris]|uniref:hypothetical protein n=1 Tax=Lactobacillus agrestimuris TaxID=2941328 RepID=UPI0020440441|nr:hypothetical protein [Lactobacillus agrestimuris]